MSGHRRAALALHGLQARDKQWLLAQLPAQDQSILQGHLQELDTLGFQYEPDLLEQLPAASEAAPAPYPALQKGPASPEQMVPDQMDPIDAAIGHIARAGAEQILLLVQDEPLGWLARLLACQPWPWQPALLEQLPAPTRQRVRTMSVPAAPQLDRSLLLALQQAIADAPTPLPAPLPQRRWFAWWRR